MTIDTNPATRAGNPAARGPGGTGIRGVGPGMGGTRVIPTYTFPPTVLPPDSTGQGTPNSVNGTAQASGPSYVQLVAASRDSVIPIVYGGTERLAGLLYTACVYNGNLLLCLILCEGPIDSIGTVDLNDAALPAGVTVTKYLGTAGQTADPSLVAAIAGFTETLANTAYIVVSIPPGVSQGYPRITALVRGLKVIDPRLNYVRFTGSTSDYVDTPDSTLLAPPSTKISVAAKIRMPDYSPGTSINIIASQLGASGTFAWEFYTNVAGNLGWASSANGTSFSINNGSSVVVPFADGAIGWVAVEVDLTTGQVAYFTRVNDNDPWLALGTLPAAAGATSIFNSNIPLRVGLRGDDAWPFPGDIFRVYVLNGSLAAGIAMADFNAGASNGGATPFVGSTGETWTFRGSATVTRSATVSTGNDNPALCFADYLIATYGARKLSDHGFWLSTCIAADRCDELVTGAGGTEKRCLISLTMAEAQRVEDWIDVLRGYIPGWVDYVGPYPRIVADAPKAAADHVFTAASIDQDPMPTLVKRGILNRPNVVEIGYTKTDVLPWITDYAVADLSPTTRRKARVEMPGIHRYSQAYRFAVERLNHYNLEALEAQIGVFESGLKVLIGDLVDVTDDIGLAATRMRVTGREDRVGGRWLLGLRKYDVNSYNSTVQTVPATPTLGLPDPKVVQPPTSSATPWILSEMVYLERDMASDSVSRGYIYQSRIQAAWIASVHAYPVVYRVQLKDSGIVIAETTTIGVTYNSPAIQQGRSYTLEVTAENSIGFRSTPLISSTLIAQGKYLLPGNVPAITTAVELGGEVNLAWTAAIDIDIDRYEWKYAPVAGFNYDTATLIDRVDGLRARFKGLPVGTWRFAVKAMDSVGGRSPVATTVDVTITSDANAFIQSRSFINPLILGAEAVLTGDMTVPGNWSLGAGWTVNTGVAGKMVATAAGSGTSAAQGGRLTIGQIYVVTFTIDSISAGGISFAIGGSTGSAVYNAPGTYTFTAVCAGDGTLGVLANGTTTAQLDNLSYKPTGNIAAIPDGAGGLLRWATSIGGDQWNTVEPNPFVGSQLITNPDMASSTGWTLQAGWTISTGKLRATAAADTTAGFQATGVIGRLYTATFTIDSITGTVKFGFGTTYSATFNAPGTYTVTGIQAGTTGMGLVAVGTLTGVFDDMTVMDITPVLGYHSTAYSKFQGESWDLGSSVTANFTMTPNVTDLVGVASYAMETSPDGVLWTPQPGVQWLGSTRFIRPGNYTVGTFIVSPPTITLAALSKTESGTSQTFASGGALVQLNGRYSAAQDLQATAINTSSPRLVVVDRILLHPQTGLMLVADTTAGDAFVRQNISTLGGYTLAVGDCLEYDVFIDSSTPAPTTFSDGGFIMVFSDASNANALTDTDGFTTTTPAIGLDPLARGMWKSRKIALTGKNGLTITNWRICLDSDGVGTHKVLFRNIRITDGGATVRVTAWSSGEPTVNTTNSSALSTNIMCGPSNSFLLYAFNDAGTQVALNGNPSLAQYSFRGF